jgi:hypothetical protein
MSREVKTLKDERELGIDYLALRRVVGCIGLLLPLSLYLGNRIVSSNLPDSMSAYYYTAMRNLLVGALCALGVFLIGYAGYDKWDRWITNVAGGGAILVAFCPAKPDIRPLSAGQNWAGDLHLGFAAITFIALGCMALRFAKAGLDGYRTPEKRQRDVIYRLCGFTIFICIALAVAFNLLSQPVRDDLPWLFILEAIAVIAFGISWLVKGATFVKDRPAGTAGQLSPPVGLLTAPGPTLPDLDRLAS